MTMKQPPTSSKSQLVIRGIVLLVLLIVGRDAYVRRLAWNLSTALNTSDWNSARRMIGPGVQFASEAERIRAFRLAAAIGDSKCLAVLASKSQAKPDFAKSSRDGLLFETISLGQKEGLLSLLAEGADVNTVTPFGSTLQRAVFSKQMELAALLKQRGAHFLPAEAVYNGDADDLERAFASGFDANSTPPVDMGDGSHLATAASHGYIKVVKLLLSHGSEANEQFVGTSAAGKQMQTALFPAAKQGTPEVIRELVRAGAKVNDRGKSIASGRGAARTNTGDPGTTPLMEAAAACNTEAVKCLLDLHANPLISLKSGENALTLAIGRSTSTRRGFQITYPVIPPFLTPDASTQFLSSMGPTRDQRIQVARLLISADPAVVKATPAVLTDICSAGLMELVPDLIAHGADVNQADSGGATPLMAAIVGRSTIALPLPVSQKLASEAAIQLLAHGADANAANSAGQTPLMVAASNNLPAVVAALIAHGASPQATDSQGISVRVYALSLSGRVGTPSESHQELISILKSSGLKLTFHEAVYFHMSADVKAMLESGTTPNQTCSLTGAVIPGYEAQYNTPKLRASTGKMIAAAITSLNLVTPLMVASAAGSTDIVQMLLAHGADIKAADSRGWTALMSSVAYNRTDTARVLIAAGSGIGDRDRRQWTPLMLAASVGAVDCIKLLVDSGARLEDRDVNGFTSLARACTAGSVPAVRYLIENHADVHAVNAAGKGMVYLARNRGHHDIADLLKSYGVQDQRGPDDSRSKTN